MVGFFQQGGLPSRYSFILYIVNPKKLEHGLRMIGARIPSALP